jgi:UDP-glucose 4-epimerase
VLVLDDLSGGFENNVPTGAGFERSSITDNLDSLFQRFRPNIVYHLAAYAAEGLSHHIPVFNYTNNLIGTANVLSAGYRAGIDHFVFTSSIAVYGHPQTCAPFREEDICIPCDPYGVAKLACENHIRVFHDYYRRPSYTIFRPHNVFGPNQNISDPYRNVVGIFMRKVLSGESLPIFGDGLQTRSFSYISGVSQCLAEAPFVTEARNQIFNIGTDEQTSVKDLARHICRIFGAREDVAFLPAREEVRHAHADHSRVRNIFPNVFAGWPSMADGLNTMAQYVKSHAAPKITDCPSGIEIVDRLPPGWVAGL